MRAPTIRRWTSSTSATGTLVHGDDQILRAKTCGRGGGAGHDLDDLHAGLATELAREARRKWPRAACDAEVCAPEATLAHQRRNDRLRRVVDGHSEPEPDTGDRRVDTDDARASIGKRTAGVSRVECGVGLDHAVDHAALARRQRPAEVGNDAGRHGLVEAVRVADGDHELADAEPPCIAELRRHELVGLGPEHGEVREWIGAHDLGTVLRAVHERGANPLRPVDDVCRGDEEAVARDDDAATAATLQLRRCATDGTSRSLTEMTTREYASSASLSSSAVVRVSMKRG